jgi:hypothetical protein
MPVNSNLKGKRGERELAAKCRKLWPSLAEELKRGCQNKGGSDSPDVIGLPGFHIEVKRVQALNLDAAMEQAATDSEGKKIPMVAHRRNRKRWKVTLYLDDVPEAVRAFTQIEKGDAA